MARVRDYKREYWRPKALALIDEVNFPIFYGRSESDVLALGDEYGWDTLTKNLRYKREMEDLWWDGYERKAHQMYLDADDDFPDWFWQYHAYDA